MRALSPDQAKGEVSRLNNNMLQEAAAAVAANHRMNRFDVLEIVRFALGTTLFLMMLMLALSH